MRRSESLQASSWIHVMCFIVSLFFFFVIVPPIALSPPSLHMESREKENVKAVLCVSERGSLEAPVATLLSRRLPSSIFFFFYAHRKGHDRSDNSCHRSSVGESGEEEGKKRPSLFFAFSFAHPSLLVHCRSWPVDGWSCTRRGFGPRGRGGKSGEVGYRSQYLPHAKRSLYHLSYIPDAASDRTTIKMHIKYRRQGIEPTTVG